MIDLYNLTNILNKQFNLMTKKSNKNTKQKSYKTLPINKDKSFIQNFNQFIKLLRVQLTQTSTKQYVTIVRKYLDKCKKKTRNFDLNKLSSVSNMITFCRKCQKLILNSKEQIECCRCEDFYHRRCLESEEQDTRDIYESEQICIKCYKSREQTLKASEKAENIIFCEIQKQDNICYHCQKQIKKQSTSSTFINKCLKCEKFYHKGCYGDNPILCFYCEEQIKDNQIRDKSDIIKSRQMSIRESFRKARLSSKNNKKCLYTQHQICQLTQKIDIKNHKYIEAFGKIKSLSGNVQSEQSTQATISTNFKKGIIFHSIFPIMSNQKIIEYQKNLKEVIACKNMIYTEDLKPQGCELELESQDSVDFITTHLHTKDYQLYMAYKKQPIGPFKIKYKQNMGFDVVSDAELPERMIVCEYIGDVYDYRTVLDLEDNDSRMFLRDGKSADEVLYIVPRKYSNIARYINGVKKGQQHKANVKSIKVQIQRRPAIILYTCKKIKKNESLLYNYNAGIFKEGYDTSEFI